ncbi:MAG: hypothetical protein Q9214_005697, partial [Letrouitia sp. 1 TL-2023]
HSSKYERCIRNFVARDTLVIATAIVNGQKGDGQMLNMHIKDAVGNEYGRAKDIAGEEKRMAFTSLADAAFDVCFENQLTASHAVMNPTRDIELDIDIGADARDWSAIQAQEKLKPVETELRRIEELVAEIVAEMEYLRTREQKLRDTNESTNERVKWFAFGTMGMLVGLGAWQVIYLRAYFSRPRPALRLRGGLGKRKEVTSLKHSVLTTYVLNPTKLIVELEKVKSLTSCDDPVAAIMIDPATSDRQDTTNILPIPPPLEFPFPPTGTDSSYPSSTVATTRASSPTTSPDANTLAVNESSSVPAKPTLEPIKFSSTPSNPTAKRHHSERPEPSQKRSILGLKRRSTGPALTALNDAAWHPDLEDTDSSFSDDEAPLKKSETVQHDQYKVQPAQKREKALDHDIDRSTSKKFSRFSVGNENFRTTGKVSKTSGRLDISVDETAKGGYLAKALGTTLQHHLQSIRKQSDDKEEEEERPSRLGSKQIQARPVLETRVSAVTGIPLPTKTTPNPKLNIVIMVIGSRGDIQPFLKIGKLLKEEHGHRVRIATHPAFKEFVEHDS